MKRNFLNILLVAVAAATFFASCDEAHEESLAKTSAVSSTTAAGGSITIENNSENTTAGIFQFAATPESQLSERESVFRHELGLLTNGFTTSYDDTEGLIVNGSGSSIWLQLYSKSKNLEEGVYTFTGSQDHGKPFDFWYGAVDSENKNYLFTEGQVIVSRTGDTYSITVEGKITTAGSSEIKSIQGSYSGALSTFKSTR
jgi:hypothetical protein